ncbi:AMP-binding protein, partial [Streptomyces hyaluromycini]
SPRATALRGPGGARLTYAALVARARAVRDLLVASGVPARGFVPVAARAGGEFAVAALGVLLAGAAYAAVDPDWPARRLREVIDDLGARVVLDATGGTARLPAGTRALPLPDPAARPPAPDAGLPAVGADDPACVFFTSGSTGRPKGVVLPHRAFVRTFVDGGYAAFGPGTVMPLLAAPYWDAGALEVFGPLMNGGSCVTPDEPLITPDGLRALVAEDGVDTLWLTSSLVNLIVDEDPNAFTGIRHLLCGGERLSPPHIAALLDRHPGLRVTNGYGPVESMVFVSTHDVRPADTADPSGIPVGRPVRGTVLAVLDPENLRPVARGTEGELWVAGDGLALGYLDRPEEDARRFTRVAVQGHGTLRAYATGDRVRMDDEDRLSYVGRADRQFKIRGHRVEPGEVERRISVLPGIRHAFLVPLRDERTTVTATACAYTTEDAAPITEHALRTQTTEALPAYLRPDHFLHLHPMPLGPTGKADLRAVETWVRERVAADAVEAAAVEGTGSPDASDVTPTLREARAVLAVPGLRPDSDLLTSGATSLHVLRIAARLSRLFGVRLSARDVYEHPSVAALAELAAARRPGRPTGDTGSGDLAGLVGDNASGREAGDSGSGGPNGLSPGERRFWLVSRLAPGASGQVAVSRIEVTGSLDPARLRQALAAVAAAHPALRTTFPRDGGRPRRNVAEAPTPPPLLVRAGTEQALTRELVARVGDLGTGPLFAAGVLGRASAGRRLLLLAVHHIVYDARSEEILVADLAAAYAGRTPEP